MEKSVVEIISDWMEKNIDVIYYKEYDLKTYKETGKMRFNREFVLSHLGGVIPDIKKKLKNKRQNGSKKDIY